MIFEFVVFVSLLSSALLDVEAAPLSSSSDGGAKSSNGGDQMPLFIQQKYRQLFMTCYKQTQSDACRLIYVVPARKCVTTAENAATAGNGKSLQMTCTFPLDGINTEQLYVVWTKISSTLKGKNIKPLSPDRFKTAYSDPYFETYVVNNASSSGNINNSPNERTFSADFELESKESIDDDGPISSPENLPFIFFFPQLQLGYIDLSSDDTLSMSSALIRRGIEIDGARQPPCKRSPLKIQTKWLLSEEQRARALFVFPAEADIGTCSHLATKLSIDTCRFSSKDWTRAYDTFRIGLRHEFESNPANKDVGDKHRLLGEPSCVPAAVSDFEYVLSEVQSKNELFRYRVVSISKFLVTKCACF